MSTQQAEEEATQFLSKITQQPGSGSDQESRDRYERAHRKAAASFERLHQAAQLASRNAQSTS